MLIWGFVLLEFRRPYEWWMDGCMDAGHDKKANEFDSHVLNRMKHLTFSHSLHIQYRSPIRCDEILNRMKIKPETYMSTWCIRANCSTYMYFSAIEKSMHIFFQKVFLFQYCLIDSFSPALFHLFNWKFAMVANKPYFSHRMWQTLNWFDAMRHEKKMQQQFKRLMWERTLTTQYTHWFR